MGPILLPISAIALLVAAVAYALVSLKRRDDRQTTQIQTKSGRFVARDDTAHLNKRLGRGPNRRLDL